MNVKAMSKNGSLQAAQAVGASIKTLLGPSSSVKCCVDDENDAIICSSAVKILQYLDHKVQHPAWFVIHDACEALYKTYGCGCKTLVCMIAFWSREAALLQHEGVPVPVIVQLFHEALTECIKVLEEIAIPLQQIKEHISESPDLTLDSIHLAKTHNMVNAQESRSCDNEAKDRLRGIDSVMGSLSLKADDNQLDRSFMIAHEGDKSGHMQVKDHQTNSAQHHETVEQKKHREEMKDEFDDCFDFPVSGINQSSDSPVPCSQTRPSSWNSQITAASSRNVSNVSIKSSAKSSLSKLELNKTEELLKNLSLTGLKGSKPKRNYSQIVKGCRNLQSDNSIKTIIKGNTLNLKTDPRYPRTSSFKQDSFDLANKEDLKLLGKMLSHGNQKEMTFAIDVIYAQMIIKKSNLARFEVDKSCINVETIIGPSGDNAQVIDGILLQANLSQVLQLPEGKVNVALVNGDVTEDFRHAGFKDSFNARKVVGKSFYDELHLREDQSWLGLMKDVLERFNIGALLARGNIDKDLQEFCQAHNVVTISNTSPKILHLLSTTLCASIIVYLTDLKESDISKPVCLHHLILPGKTTLYTPSIVLKPCVYNDPSSCTTHELPDRVEHNYNALMQTVVLCAPSIHLVMDSELAFWNCISRLRNSINQGSVLSGAGYTELACIKKLRNLSDKYATQDVTRQDKSSNWLKASQQFYRQAVYTAVSDGLTEFVTNVLLNTGQFVHHGQALTRVHEVLEGKYQDLLHCMDEGNSKPSILSVADDIVAKSNAWRRAVGVVCILIQSDMIVETGMDRQK